MRWYSVLAIYLLFWTLTLFVVLPHGIRTSHAEGGVTGPGHAPSAPHRFSLAGKLLWTTIISAVAFALFYANWVNGWIDRNDLPRFSDWVFGL
jgi:predicted secreted protein